MGASVLIAGRCFDAHDKAQARQHISVMHMRGAPWLLRIVADHSAFLVPVEQLHRGDRYR
jgi:hypothetical protein